MKDVTVTLPKEQFDKLEEYKRAMLENKILIKKSNCYAGWGGVSREEIFVESNNEAVNKVKEAYEEQIKSLEDKIKSNNSDLDKSRIYQDIVRDQQRVIKSLQQDDAPDWASGCAAFFFLVAIVEAVFLII